MAARSASALAMSRWPRPFSSLCLLCLCPLLSFQLVSLAPRGYILTFSQPLAALAREEKAPHRDFAIEQHETHETNHGERPREQEIEMKGSRVGDYRNIALDAE